MSIPNCKKPKETEINSNIVNGSAVGSLRSIYASEEDGTYTMGSYSFAEGKGTKVSNWYAHAEGSETTASYMCAHAEGRATTSSGYASHAEGTSTIASGQDSHAEGDHTEASGNSQHVQGKYNIKDTNNKYAHIVGNGTDGTDGVRSNAHTIDWNGNAWFSGNVKVGGTGQDDTNAKELATKEYVDNNAGGLNETQVNTLVDNKLYHNAELTLADQGIDYIDFKQGEVEYNFSYDGVSTFTSTNQNKDNSTCTSEISFLKAFNGKIKWEVKSEKNYDKLSISVNGVAKVTDESNTSGEFECNLPQGQKVLMTYAKDNSNSTNGDTATITFVTNGRKSNFLQETTLSSANYNNITTFLQSDNTNITSSSVDKFYTSAKPGDLLVQDMGDTTNYFQIVSINAWTSYKSAGGRFYVHRYYYYDSGMMKSFSISGDVFQEPVQYYIGDTCGEETGGKACFTEDTLVYTENGMKSIIDIKENDNVYSASAEGDIELKPIDKLVTHSVNEIYEIKTDTETIKASYSHPFYIEGIGKVEAKDLKVGYSLKDVDEHIHIIKEINISEKDTTVYEIRVKDNHNYFVGNDKIFVYNENSILD